MAFREPKKWMDWLPTTEWWYNRAYHTSLQMSLFEALYGYSPPQIGKLSISPELDAGTTNTLQTQQEMMKVLQENLLKAQNRMKFFADRNRVDRHFTVGDLVYLKMQPYRETALGLRNALKLTSKFYGPFRVIQRVGNVSYKLQFPERTKLHDMFHLNQLKKHVGPNVVPNPMLLVLTSERKIKTAPAHVLQARQTPRSAGDYDIPVDQWLIHWENLSADQATWEDVNFVRAAFPNFKP